MDRSHPLPRICLYATVGLSVLGIVLRTLAFLTCFDIQIGYFDPGLLPTLSNILFAVAAAAAILFAVLTPAGTVANTLHTPKATVPAFVMGIVLVAFAFGAFILCNPLVRGDLLVVATLFGLLGSSYYFVVAVAAPNSPTGRLADWQSTLGFLPILWAIAALAETYVDRYVAMNSPVKISLHMALIGYLLIMITELRFRLGKPVPRLALCLLSLGTVFSLVGATPVLIATGAKVLADIPHTLYAAVLLFGGLYGLYLLISLVTTTNSTTDPSTN